MYVIFLYVHELGFMKFFLTAPNRQSSDPAYAVYLCVCQTHHRWHTLFFTGMNKYMLMNEYAHTFMFTSAFPSSPHQIVNQQILHLLLFLQNLYLLLGFVRRSACDSDFTRYLRVVVLDLCVFVCVCVCVCKHCCHNCLCARVYQAVTLSRYI
jgi:hypothetical protein